MNDWKGNNTGSFSLGEDLPNGTYWYILDLGNGDEARTGYVYINR